MSKLQGIQFFIELFGSGVYLGTHFLHSQKFTPSPTYSVQWDKEHSMQVLPDIISPGIHLEHSQFVFMDSVSRHSVVAITS